MYIRPDAGDNKVVYKGKRFWVVQLNGTSDVDGWSKEDCDFVMFDGVFGATIALITKLEGIKVRGSLKSHVELNYDFDSLEEAIKCLPGLAERYYKAC